MTKDSEQTPKLTEERAADPSNEQATDTKEKMDPMEFFGMILQSGRLGQHIAPDRPRPIRVVKVGPSQEELAQKEALSSGEKKPSRTETKKGQRHMSDTEKVVLKTTNTQATKRTCELTEPPARLGSTGHALNEVYKKAIPAQVPKTGQTTSHGDRDDGELQRGVAWPDPRFTDNGDTVTDNLTGLRTMATRLRTT